MLVVSVKLSNMISGFEYIFFIKTRPSLSEPTIGEFLENILKDTGNLDFFGYGYGFGDRFGCNSVCVCRNNIKPEFADLRCLNVSRPSQTFSAHGKHPAHCDSVDGYCRDVRGGLDRDGHISAFSYAASVYTDCHVLGRKHFGSVKNCVKLSHCLIGNCSVHGKESPCRSTVRIALIRRLYVRDRENRIVGSRIRHDHMSARRDRVIEIGRRSYRASYNLSGCCIGH